MAYQKSYDNRGSMIAKIHIAKKQLRLEDDDYRAILNRVTGKDSCADLSNQQLDQVIDELKAKGFKTAKKYKARARTGKKRKNPMAPKIIAMWWSLYWLGVADGTPQQGLSPYIKRMTNVDHIDWLDMEQSSHVIECMKQWASRKTGIIWPVEDRVDHNTYHGGHDVCDMIITIQWIILQKAGVMPIEKQWRDYILDLGQFGDSFSSIELNDVIKHLGRMIRKLK